MREGLEDRKGLKGLINLALMNLDDRVGLEHHHERLTADDLVHPFGNLRKKEVFTEYGDDGPELVSVDRKGNVEDYVEYTCPRKSQPPVKTPRRML